MASPGITDERAPCYVAWGLTATQAHPDREESLARRRVSFAEAVAACLEGEIVDGPSVATILAVHAKALRGDLPNDLLTALQSEVARSGTPGALPEVVAKPSGGQGSTGRF